MTTRINKQDLIMQIRANPADPQLFELYFCPTCQKFVAAGGLFPALAEQVAHRAHSLAVIPAQDSPLTAEARAGLILSWLESYRLKLPVERYRDLLRQASYTNSGNWVWVLRGDEQTGWLAFLNRYLDRLAESWLEALNGRSSDLFPAPGAIWRNFPFDTGTAFAWDEAALPLAGSIHARKQVLPADAQPVL